MHEDSCAALSADLAEPLAGTAAVTTGWLCLEQPGPWGRNAPVQSGLDPDLGRELAERAGAHGFRLQLIRRPGRHADTAAPRTALVARSTPGGALRRFEVDDPAALLDLDLSATDLGRPADPVLLVCTNGRRDRCCALLGRDLVRELGDRPDVWETSHTGGHRFAPASVLLPSGYTFGRLDGAAAREVLAAAGRGELARTGCRGRSPWSHAGQAAELAVRELVGEHRLDALRVDESGPDPVVVHQDGRRWRAVVREQPLEPPRPNSCGGAPVRPSATSVTSVDPLP
ncbi:sucrase ferredoxin [Saccharopolyspora cebuensis]|uniref:Sucrase ferredoxin n=1 Tax=Saccharopolyspora cebuensis TaxID=418759 RepID=A0ABV4CUM5_9PSEU